MRIIAGTARGVTLFSPKHDARPTTDRAREAIFSKLTPRLPGARVADLFAGSGAMGLEAVSRGAASAVLVESHRGACDLIHRNAAKARLQAAITVRTADVYAWLKRAAGPFDLIFADPPYDHDGAAPAHPQALLAAPGLPALLAEDGIFVLESLAGRPIVVPFPWRLFDQRTYGKSLISFFQTTPARPADPPPHAA